MPLNLTQQLINFGITWAGSWKIGAQFPNWCYLPMIVGYMTVGFLAGPNVTGMLSPEDTVSTKTPYSIAVLVSNTTLAFIAFSAGAELHIPSLVKTTPGGGNKLLDIITQIFFMAFFMLGIGTPLVFLCQALMPEALLQEETECRWAAAWLIAVVQLAGSVIEVLAIYHETKGRGPVTQMMIGVTMLLDIIVLIVFAVSQNVVIAACPIEGIEISMLKSTLSVFGSVVLWVVCGVLLGLLLQAYMTIPGLGPRLNLIKPILIVASGSVGFYALLEFNKFLPKLGGNIDLLRVDPLLVCMVASIWVNHVSSQRDGFRDILDDLAPLIMPPFFTIAGATLDLETIVANWKAPPVLFTLRFLALAVGSYLASMASKQHDKIKQNLWMTLQSQSGVTLGLVAQMQMGLMGEQPWAKGTAAIITGCVVINQLVGPTMCRYGIKAAGECEDDREAEKEALALSYDPGVDNDLKQNGAFQPARSRRKSTAESYDRAVSKAQAIRPRTGSVLSTAGEFQRGVSEFERTREAMSTRIPEEALEEDDFSSMAASSKRESALAPPPPSGAGNWHCCGLLQAEAQAREEIAINQTQTATAGL
jgi:hypothetical protein